MVEYVLEGALTFNDRIIYEYLSIGTKGKDGEEAGKGGHGGYSGYPGRIHFDILEQRRERVSPTYEVKELLGKEGRDGTPGLGGKEGYGGRTYYGFYQESVMFPNLRGYGTEFVAEDKTEKSIQNKRPGDSEESFLEETKSIIKDNEEEQKTRFDKEKIDINPEKAGHEGMKVVGKYAFQGIFQGAAAHNPLIAAGGQAVVRTGARAANITPLGGALLSASGFLKFTGVSLAVQIALSVAHAAVRNGWLSDGVMEYIEENGDHGKVSEEKNTSGLFTPMFPDFLVVKEIHKEFLDYFIESEEYKARIVDMLLEDDNNADER